MKILFLGSIVENELFNKLLSSAKNNKPSIAGQRFERLIASGLREECDIELLSYLPTPPYPISNKIVSRFKKTSFNNIKLTYIPLINITFLKQLLISIFSFIYVFFWCLKNRKRKKRILLNLVYVPTALPVLIISKILNVPVTVLVPDVSSYRFNYTKRQGRFKNSVFQFVKKISERLDSMFDAYIFLTKAMDNLINKKGKPYIVIEGMVEKNIEAKEQVNNKQKNRSKKCMMYAGSLREKYGIINLIKAFELLDLNDTELWIFGTGDIEDKIQSIALHNNKIKFFGLRPQEEVFEYEKKATLLVNPRPSNELFTNYSFPSKTLEYMSSGTPLLTTKLPGIPEEYYKYLYFFEKESVDGMKTRLNEILSMNKEGLEKKGEVAKEFVYTNKNNIVQTRKIYSFLKNLY